MVRASSPAEAASRLMLRKPGPATSTPLTPSTAARRVASVVATSRGGAAAALASCRAMLVDQSPWSRLRGRSTRTSSGTATARSPPATASARTERMASASCSGVTLPILGALQQHSGRVHAGVRRPWRAAARVAGGRTVVGPPPKLGGGCGTPRDAPALGPAAGGGPPPGAREDAPWWALPRHALDPAPHGQDADQGQQLVGFEGLGHEAVHRRLLGLGPV